MIRLRGLSGYIGREVGRGILELLNCFMEQMRFWSLEDLRLESLRSCSCNRVYMYAYLQKITRLVMADAMSGAELHGEMEEKKERTWPFCG